MNVYEGMFMLDPALATEWPAAEAEIQRVLGRADAELIGLRNWDERRLAYPIGQHKRGLYALGYFRAKPGRIAGLERDVQLSEKFIRAIFLRHDRITEEAIQKSLAAPPPKPIGRPEDRMPRGDDRRRRPDDGEPRFGRGRGPEEDVPPVEELDVDIPSVVDVDEGDANQDE